MPHEVILERGQHRQSLIVRGDIGAWLRHHNARETKTGFNVGGWRCSVFYISDETMDRIDRILGRDVLSNEEPPHAP